MITGAGECIDSFFAFGFLQISKNSEDYPSALIEVMEPIVQEEARHIMFIHNWLLYMRYCQKFPIPQIHGIKTLLAFASAGWSRLMDLKKWGKSLSPCKQQSWKNLHCTPKNLSIFAFRKIERGWKNLTHACTAQNSSHV